MNRFFRAIPIAAAWSVAVNAQSAAPVAQRVSAPDTRVADSLLAAKQYEAAADTYEKLARATADPRAWYQAGVAASGTTNHLRAAHAFVRATATQQNVRAMYNAAAMYAQAGEIDSGFVWMMRALGASPMPLSALNGDPNLAPMRSDRRFAALMDSATARLTPCNGRANRHRFDFWIGTWEVRNAQGQVAGHSVIEPVSGGCALLENWTDAIGTSGKSLSTYNPMAGQWQQYWVGQFGDVTPFLRSEWRGESLVFFTDVTDSSGVKSMRRLTFSPIGPDSLRHFGELSTDGGVTWRPQTDLRYRRVP